jgi:hypothetical protein
MISSLASSTFTAALDAVDAVDGEERLSTGPETDDAL